MRKEAFFNNADIFVFPTYYTGECFPLVLLEAMQHSVPCISTKEGAIADIIDDGYTGLLSESKNVNDLADKIAWMMDHIDERSQMGNNGYKKYEKIFTISAFENILCGILHNIVNPSPVLMKRK